LHAIPFYFNPGKGDDKKMNFVLIAFWVFILVVIGASKIKYKSVLEAYVYKTIIFLIFAIWTFWIAGWSMI